MTSMFDLPFDRHRHLIPSERMRETIILGACSPSYQRFLRRTQGRCVVLDLHDQATIVIAGAIKIGTDAPMSVDAFLALVARGERPWERPQAGTADVAEDKELLASFAKGLEAILDEDDQDLDASSEPGMRRMPLTADERRRGLACEKYEVTRPGGETETIYHLK